MKSPKPNQHSEPTERRHILVSGHVQGVGYRYFCCNAAAKLKLTGWVRNLPDSGVELEAQGRVRDLDTLVTKLRAGPALARVSEVSETLIHAVQGETGFDVRY